MSGYINTGLQNKNVTTEEEEHLVKGHPVRGHGNHKHICTQQQTTKIHEAKLTEMEKERQVNNNS